MKRLFVSPAQLADATIPLEARQLHYLRDVLRVASDEQLEVFDGEGNSFRACLRGEALVRGEKVAALSRALDVVLAQALAKGEKMDFVVQKATELGVSRIVPVIAERAVVRVDRERGSTKAERWRRIAQEAARQCGRSDVPFVDEPREWADVLRRIGEEPERRGVLLDPEETSLRLGAAARGAARILLAIGPEGGFSPQEREMAVRAGVLAAGLGPRILRTETAAVAALAIVLHVRGELG
jgi:16S rRNA (uracil1498-N3)-methyltransferase